MGVRWLGLLQPFELKVYDLMICRRDEGRDDRLVVITIDSQDQSFQDRQNQIVQSDTRQESLSEWALEELLRKLQEKQARVIGLDIYWKKESQNENLVTQLKKKNFFAVYRAEDAKNPNEQTVSIAPPSEVSKENIGFADISIDNQEDDVLRRHLLAMKKPNELPKFSLSFLLAVNYLITENIPVKISKEVQRLGQVNLKEKQLRKPLLGYGWVGGYSGRNFDDSGYQILLNYRTPKKIAQTISLGTVLTGSNDLSVVKDQIVLIGSIDPNRYDRHLTPYTSLNRPNEPKMYGVMIQAQMVSQLISAVKDDRPLLWVLPLWGDIAWVWIWAIIGGAIGWVGRLLPRFITTGITLFFIAVLILGCFEILTKFGGWVPLIPAGLAWIITVITVRIVNCRFSKEG